MREDFCKIYLAVPFNFSCPLQFHMKVKQEKPITPEPPAKPRVGISSCLLGEEVRYDGGHKLHYVIVDIVGPKVEWVPVCPEMEMGLGVPREPLNLVGDPDEPLLLDSKTGMNWTLKIAEFARQKIEILKIYSLDGYIFKNKSPSCGIDDVKVYRDISLGDFVLNGRGAFANLFLAQFPSLPVTDEGKLSTVEDSNRFLKKVYRHQQNRERNL